MSKDVTISVAEWLDELQRTTTGPDGYQTVAEMREVLCDRTGQPWSPLRVRNLLREAQAAGRLTMAPVSRPRLDGRIGLVTGYRILPEPRKPSRK